MTAINTSGMVARRRFGQALQQARLEAKVTQKAALAAMGKAKDGTRRTGDRVSLIERGKSWPTPEELAGLCECYGLDPVATGRLEALLEAGSSMGKEWWAEYRDFDDSLLQFCAYEDAAKKVTTVMPSGIPGNLVTEGTIRAALAAWRRVFIGKAKEDRVVELRLKRREIYLRPNPVELDVTLSEGALLQNVGGPQVRAEQIDFLIDVSRKNHVTLRILPFSSGLTLSTSLHYIEFPGADEKPLVAYDGPNSVLFEEKPAEVRAARELTALAIEESLSILDSYNRLIEIKEELHRGHSGRN